MGYSDGKIAMSFWVFGFAVMIGAATGCIAGYATMPFIYREMAIDGLPIMSIGFYPWLPLALVIAPSAAFLGLSCFYALLSIKNQSAASMLKGGIKRTGKIGAVKKDRPFLRDMRSSVLRAKKSAVFFIAFSCFCFSAMLQMGFSMRDLSSIAMGSMIISIGAVLSVTAMIMAITTVINGNARNIAVMKAFGYTRLERAVAVLFGYIPFAAIGYGVGTVYQYVLLKLMLAVIFDGVVGVPDYSFDVPVFFGVLALFIAVYAVTMSAFSRRIEKIPVKSASAFD